MTTQIEGKRIKEAYRLALVSGAVTRHVEMFRDGRMVQFRIDDDTGFSDGLKGVDRIAVVGQYQLRYYSQHRGQPSTSYAVMGRLSDTKSDASWIPVDGPWRVGDGPFDRKRAR